MRAVVVIAGGRRGPPGRAVAMIVAGVLLVSLYFALAPRSPARLMFDNILGELTDTVASILGITGAGLVVAGRLLWVRETSPHMLPQVAALVGAIAVWVPLVIAVKEMLGLEGVSGLLLVEVALVPLLVALAVVFERLLRRLA